MDNLPFCATLIYAIFTQKLAMIKLDKSLQPLRVAFNKTPDAYKFLAILSPT
jgi:hypothetical protein